MELRTERKLSQKALAEQLQLAGYEFSDLTVLRIEKGTRFVPDYEVENTLDSDRLNEILEKYLEEYTAEGEKNE